MRSVFVIFVSIAMAPFAMAQLELAAPEEAGLSGARLSKVMEFVRRDIGSGKIAGAVTLISRYGKIVHFDTAGTYGLDDKRAMEKDTLFRIYSMTKPITTVAAMMLYEEGRFQMGDPVSKYLTEFSDQKILRDGKLVAPLAPMTIEQLMTHSAGLTYGWANDHPTELAYQEAKLDQSKDTDDFINRLAGLPLRFEPGTRYHYSVATDVLGALVERLSGMTLEKFFSERIFNPLGMHDTFFNVPKDKMDRLASNHYWDTEIKAMAVIPNAYSRPVTGLTVFSGGGGLISTALDYMVFCEMVRQGGSYNGVRILGPKTVEYMTINHLTDTVRNNGADEYPGSHLYPGQSFGLGFGVITDPGQSGVISSIGEYSWGGLANTKFWIDPKEELIAVFMSQFMASPWSDETRFNMKVATYQALTELNSN